MTWFKIDDKSTFHAKIVDAGNEAWGAVCRAGAWSSERLTDGRVPWPIALAIASRSVWNRAFKAGLCDAVGDGEFQIHDYLDWNPSRDEVLRLRALRSDSGRTGGKRRHAKPKAAVKPLLKQVPTNGEAKINPDPDPDPVPKEEEEAARLPGLAMLETEIRRHDLFADLDAHAIAKSQAERLITAPQKPEWLVEAIRECAEKNVGQGLQNGALQSLLVGFMRRAKRPKAPEPEPPKVEDFSLEKYRRKR